MNHWIELGSVAGPLIQANGRLNFENDLRSGGLLYCVSQWISIHTELANSMGLWPSLWPSLWPGLWPKFCSTVDLVWVITCWISKSDDIVTIREQSGCSMFCVPVQYSSFVNSTDLPTCQTLEEHLCANGQIFHYVNHQTTKICNSMNSNSKKYYKGQHSIHPEGTENILIMFQGADLCFSKQNC